MTDLIHTKERTQRKITLYVEPKLSKTFETTNKLTDVKTENSENCNTDKQVLETTV